MDYKHHQYSLGYKISSDLQKNYHFVDKCLRVRHFFAKKGVCLHRGYWENMFEYFTRLGFTERDDGVWTKE